MRFNIGMKSSRLPPVRVEPSVRDEIEAALQQGEILSEFLVKVALEAARVRRAQEEFLAGGRASLARAKQTGEFDDANQILSEMLSI